MNVGFRWAQRMGICAAMTALSMQAATAQSQDLWPMKKGAKWVLQSTAISPTNGSVKSAEQSVKVLSSKHSKAGTMATLEYSINGKVSQVERYITTPTGVFRSAGGKDGNASISPILPIIKYPATTGAKWSWAGTIAVGKGKLNMTQESTVVGVEKVKTPSGTYQAVHIRAVLASTASGRRDTFVNDLWFAPGVGMVQQKAVMGPLNVSAVLSKVTPGE